MNSLVVNFKKGTLSPTAEIQALEAEALAKSAQIVHVNTAAEQELAVAAQATLARFIRNCDNSAEAAKKPINLIRAKIIEWNKEMIKKADAEGMRVAQLVNEFQLAESRRVAAARRAQDETASALERVMEQKISTARSLDEIEAIRENFRDKIAAEAPPVEDVARSSGQVVKQEWDITVQDIHLLYRHHPNCVKLTALNGEIKELLNGGATVRGVLSKKITKSGVRLTKELPAIEIQTHTVYEANNGQD